MSPSGSWIDPVGIIACNRRRSGPQSVVPHMVRTGSWETMRSHQDGASMHARSDRIQVRRLVVLARTVPRDRQPWLHTVAFIRPVLSGRSAVIVVVARLARMSLPHFMHTSARISATSSILKYEPKCPCYACHSCAGSSACGIVYLACWLRLLGSGQSDSPAQTGFTPRAVATAYPVRYRYVCIHCL